MEIKKVGICGFGQMGTGIAEVSAKAGVEIIAYEPDQKFLDKGLARINKSLTRAVEKGKLDETTRVAALEKISGTTDLNGLADCDLVIEAIVENLEPKIELYKKLDGIVKKDAIFASNTSSLSITQMAAATELSKLLPS